MPINALDHIACYWLEPGEGLAQFDLLFERREGSRPVLAFVELLVRLALTEGVEDRKFDPQATECLERVVAC